MYIRKLAAAAGFACGAALAFAPVGSADASTDWLSAVDGLIGGASPAASLPDLNLAISFDGISLLSSGTAKATTDAGQFGLAIASGDHATAYAAGGYGDTAMASGTYALAEAGSKTAGATGFNFDSATDIGNNVDPSTITGAPDGAYAGGASLIGGVDATGASSNDTAQFIGNGGISPLGDAYEGDFNGGNSGAFAGDSGLIGYGSTAGSGDTAYTSGNIFGFGDGSAAVGGNSNGAFTTGTETGQNEGAFSGFGNYNSATADVNYTTDGNGVSATFGNGNYALAYGADNSTANAGTGNYDLAEVLGTHGDASAQNGNYLYDIISLLGNTHSASLPAAADPAAADPLASTVSGEISSLNSMFVADANLYSVGNDLVGPTAGQPFETITLAGAPDAAPFNAFDYMLYGLNPAANAVGDPGAYDLFNGALVRLDDALNVGLYALENGGNMLPVADFATDLFGVTAGSDLATQLAGETASQAINTFLQLGSSDVLGYFGL